VNVLEAKSRFSGYLGAPELLTYANLRSENRWGTTANSSLGMIPRPLFLAVRDCLVSAGEQISSPHETRKRSVPLTCRANHDRIKSDDFEVDVPEFESRPEWFRTP